MLKINPGSHLARYLEERNGLLNSITDLLKNDPIVRTACLFGSLGRGDGDALSDIDLWVVVDDDQIHNIIAGSIGYAFKIGQPILTLEAPQNAPEGGAYLMTCFDAPVAPHIVDWYWQPTSLAFLPDEIHVLFDRVGLIHEQRSIRFSGQLPPKEILDRPMHFISYFWMMLMITAKYACRYPKEEKMELLPYLVEALEQAGRFIRQERDPFLGNLPDYRCPEVKVQLLYRLADLMCKLMERIAAQGEEVPTPIVSGAYRYLKLVELTIKDW